jgi:uncharacterized alkaline shock family protein YloU
MMTDGKTTIAPEVLQSIARLTTLNIPGVSRLIPVTSCVNRFFNRGASMGVHIDVVEDSVYTDIYVVLKNDVNIRDVSRTIQQEVARAITEMVGMRVGRVNIHIEDVDYPSESEV